MDMGFFVRLISVGMLVWIGFSAWKRKDRRALIDAALIVVSMVALLIPAPYLGLRYGIAGVALAIVMSRAVKRDLIDGSDSHARMMTIGILGFVASLILVAALPSPTPTWAKYVVIGAGVLMMVALLSPLVWMTRLLFSAHRLSRDRKHSRPPREADEKVLGIDLSPLRRPDTK